MVLLSKKVTGETILLISQFCSIFSWINLIVGKTSTFLASFRQSFFRKKQKKPIKDQRNEGLQPKTIDDKLWEYQNQNA